MRLQYIIGLFSILLFYTIMAFVYPPVLWSLVVVGPLVVVSLVDFFQTHHAIRRNFPILGRFRYWLEAVRPEIQQYFIEGNTDGRPFSREQRSVVYQRAKQQLDTLPFGTQRDVYAPGYEWVNHSLAAGEVDPDTLRITIGGPDCKKPYNASILNISAMSFGSLSTAAVLALNGGAKDGNFAHNTGEGSISPYHKEPGGDLIWQIGTGYFGCRTPDGEFDPEMFAEKAQDDQVKMIEIKLSQGAKPGHGGILPKEKVDKIISDIRGVPMGVDIISPPVHSTFSTPIGMMEYIKQLRDLSGGKPVGIKLCVGKRREFIAVCKAMVKTGITPDYIAVDGGEGGTGAAPLEFSNHIGTPGTEGLIFVHDALVGFSLRDKVKIIASGKVNSGFGMVKLLALGADAVYAARSFMLALGCIQALRCNSNHCPTGVATQDPSLVAGLVVSHKRPRVHLFHKETIRSCAEIIGAMGKKHSEELRRWNIQRRVTATDIRHYGELYPYLADGALLGDNLPEMYRRTCEAAVAESFFHVEQLADLEREKSREKTA